MKNFYKCFLFLLLLCIPLKAHAENQRLILKDGSYQIVTRYEIAGDRVRYISAERGGQWEEIPRDLVDWDATTKWNQQHTEDSRAGADAAAAAIDAEEAAERAAEIARTPLVAPGLNLPDSDGVWALDTYKNVPELIEMEQNNGQLNAQKAHNILHAAINPLATARQTLNLPGRTAHLQMHTSTPEIYISLDEPDDPGKKYENDSGALTVDTKHATAPADTGGFSSSQYVIVRAEQRRDERIVGIFKVSVTGKQTNSEDVLAATAIVLSGHQWMKVTPQAPLSPGEYALVELLPKNQINLDVWDFGVNPQAPENIGAQTPIHASSKR